MSILALVPLAGGHEIINTLPIPAWTVGGLMLIGLLIALSAVRGVGQGRPHSMGSSDDTH